MDKRSELLAEAWLQAEEQAQAALLQAELMCIETRRNKRAAAKGDDEEAQVNAEVNGILAAFNLDQNKARLEALLVLKREHLKG